MFDKHHNIANRKTKRGKQNLFKCTMVCYLLYGWGYHQKEALNHLLQERGGKKHQPDFGRGLAFSRQCWIYSLAGLYNVSMNIKKQT